MARGASAKREAMGVVAMVVLLAWFGSLSVLAAFALHRYGLVLREARLPRAAPDPPDPAFRPHVTVQLPLYNERFVVGRLLDAVGALRWPRDRLEVQVLDDSTDETSAIAAAGAARLRAAGVPAVHLQRRRRAGYKAGALAGGLRCAAGEFVLVLDADFVPPPDLLERLMPAFRDPRVGMVQARWGHANADETALTRVQALLLDAHFLLESDVRARSGLFFNFNGTAGVWRVRAIEEAGGWSADTLTEDLDLSYRAQMAGWRFVFRPDVVVPAELPRTLAAFRQQQARWTQGAAGTARKLLGRLLAGPWPAAVRYEAAVHLTQHVVFPATLLAALLMLPSLLVRRAAGLEALFLLDVVLAAAIIAPTRAFYAAAARRAGSGKPGLLGMTRLLVTGTALAAGNTRAALEGWLRRSGTFERTPKAPRGRPAPGYAARPRPLLRWLEGGTAVYLAAGAILAAAHGWLGASPFLAMLALGFGATAVRS
jgi:hypothetical protein